MFHCIRKIIFLLFFWVLVMLTMFHLRGYHHQVLVSPLRAVSWRLLQQNRLIPLTRHTNSATESFGLELDISKSPSLSKDMLLLEVQNRMPNLAITYWNKYKKEPMYINSTCAIFPSIFELEFNNLYWQTLRTTNGTFQLYGAYYDIRKKNKMRATIRILGMINIIKPTVATYCQVWYDEKNHPLIVKTFEYIHIWDTRWGNYKGGIYQPYLISCRISENYSVLVPSSVSLVEKPCDYATNNLRVIFDKPEEKKDFAVCVKGLDFLHADLSVHLVEWIELLGLLGADKIFFYELHIHPNISKVLKHYEGTGQVQVTPTSLAGGQSNIPTLQHLYLTEYIDRKRQNELIPYNDCFYKHMYQYKYIALLDIDEVIMPINNQNWKELMDVALSKALKMERASYNVRNVFFLNFFLRSHGRIKDIPKYMHMLRHVYRAENFTRPRYYVKCFHNTEQVLALHNHFPLKCLENCRTYSIETSDAQLQHYKPIWTIKNFRRNIIMDTTIWRYKEPLVNRVTRTLKKLGLFSENGER